MIDTSNYDWAVYELTPLELLGYAKNNIVEAKEKASYLSQEYLDKLDVAYSLVDEVQKLFWD